MTAAGAGRLTGAALGVLYLGVVTLKLRSGETHELIWLCHACLLLAALALLLDRDALARAVLICMIVPTLIWWLDGAALLFTGRLIVGAIDPPRTLAQWAGTSHHLFLAPLLLAINARRAPARADAVLAGTIITLLILAAFLAAPAWANTNWSHAVLPGVDHPLVHAWNGTPPIARLPMTVLGGIVLIVAPGVVALRATALEPSTRIRADLPAATR